jgi:glycosyltransferase involved in cell wall biosynthesis
VKVLLLHQHFNTPEKGGAIRSYYLAKALVSGGVKVTVISGHNDKRYVVQNIEGVEVHYLPVRYYNRFGFYKRGFSFIRYIRGAVKLSAQFRDVDLVYAMSVPLTVGIAAMRIQKLYKIPFLFEVGDLWPDAPIQLGFIRNKLIQKSLYLLEKKIYEASSAIVALSEPIKRAIEQKIPGKRIYVVPNMADIDFFVPQEKNPILERKFNVEERFVISYIGAIGFANGLDYLLECARESKHAGLNLHFLVCGEGAMLSRLKNSTESLGLDNLSFISFQSREGVKEIMNVTDANFVSYRPVPILETGSPNKYFDSLAAGKLTIINFGGWVKEEIEREKCGIYVDCNRPADLVDKVKIFIDDKTLLKNYQHAGRQLAESKYARVKLSEEYADIIKKQIGE